MKTYIENMTVQSIVYMRQVGPYCGVQNFQLMESMKEWIRNQNLWNEFGIIYGIAQDNAAITPPEQCRYDVCFITEKVYEDNTIHQGILPAGVYLVCEVVHSVNEVKCFWATIGDILKQESSRFDESRPVLERYPFRLVERGYCEFCIPVFTE